MTIADRLYTGSFNSFTVYIYDEGENRDYWFHANVEPESVIFDGEEITLDISTPLSHMEIILPLPESEAIWDEESESYEYTVKGNRYELYF